jgi:hypothetical protein
MNVEQAVEWMKQSVSVQDWNERRVHVYNNMEVDFKWYVQAIDAPDEEGVGLIVKTLGKDGEKETEA